MKLVIGNKNYSSWSMRPWVLMREAGIAFDEVLLPFDDMAPGGRFKRELAAYTPTGRVPVLIDDDGTAVWDTLAIAERLAERFPDRQLWPRDANARARARSIVCEMHSGFGALRNAFGMNIEASLPEIGAKVLAEQPAVVADLARIRQIWTDALAASGGPMLFGAFSIADAFFAPVVMRIATYAVPLPPQLEAYADRVKALPSVTAWCEQARAEGMFVPIDEPYRTHR